MAPTLLFEIDGIDLDAEAFSAERIEQYNPQRHPLRMLDRIAYESEDLSELVAFKHVGHDEFWAPAHIPGRPIFPGVLMIEAAAQLASIQCKRVLGLTDGFIGFAAVDKVKFRGQVLPGHTLMLLGKQVEARPRRCIADVQGWVDGGLVFEGRVTGMPI
ncbi:MAG: 3-hydroxyacyl-ACP dehydratase FabZ family protein [Planctomycetota bacterium]